MKKFCRGRASAIVALLLVTPISAAHSQPADDGQVQVANTISTKAPCMVRKNADGNAIGIRVSAVEAARYEALGYTATPCASEETAAFELSSVCVFAATILEEGKPYLEERYGVPIEDVCRSARLAAQALGLTLDETDPRPEWAKAITTAAKAALLAGEK